MAVLLYELEVQEVKVEKGFIFITCRNDDDQFLCKYDYLGQATLKRYEKGSCFIEEKGNLKTVRK